MVMQCYLGLFDLWPINLSFAMPTHSDFLKFSLSSRPYFKLTKQSLILTYANAYGKRKDMIGIVWNQNAEVMGVKIQEDADHNITFSIFHIYLT